MHPKFYNLSHQSPVGSAPGYGDWFIDLPTRVTQDFDPNGIGTMLPRWNPDVFAFHHFNRAGSGKITDFPSVIGNGWHCVSPRLMVTIMAVADPVVESLPIRLRDSIGEQVIDGYQLLRYLGVVDAVDKKHSQLLDGEVDFELHNGTTYYLDRVVLRRDRLLLPVCRIVGCEHLHVYREDVAQAIIGSGFSGLRFEEVEVV